MEAIYAGIALTGPTPDQHCGPIKLPWDIGLNIAPLVRAEAPFIRSLKNRSCMVSFPVQRRYESILDALEARFLLYQDLPSSGVLEFSQDSGGETLLIVALATLAPMPEPVFHTRLVEFDFRFAVTGFSATRLTNEGVLRNDATGEALLSDSGHALLS